MKNVYLHEFNVLMGSKVYLPNATGMIRAFAETRPKIVANYRFAPFQFIRKKPEEIADMWDKPSVLAFSSSVWNHRFNLELAKLGRARFPNALIVFGGPHTPGTGTAFLEQYLFVDVVVRREGEVTFAELLEAYSDGSRDFRGVTGLIYRDLKTGKIIRTSDRGLANVNTLPSPYLQGFYNDLLDHRGDTEYQVILETNRGCPFRCDFCYWNNGSSKVLMFDLERIRREITWLGEQKIPYVFGADANFGMIPRDLEIAEMFASVKRLTGYPHSFSVCYGKNAVDRVFDAAKVLHGEKLCKGVTVSFQSLDETTLKNIGRDNIKLDVYRELIRRYRAATIPIYTEIIIGLPGETFESFAKGIEEVFQAGMYDQVGIFLCSVLPNTDMADPDYQVTHGIVTKRIELVEIHSSTRLIGEVIEYDDIIVATKTMPPNDWRRTVTLAWMAQVIHGVKLGFFISLYLFERFGIKYVELFEHLLQEGKDPERFRVLSREIATFTRSLDGILLGKPQCVFLPEFGEISWQLEEATFLTIVKESDAFYSEFEILVCELLHKKGIAFDRAEVSEAFLYQSGRMASLLADRETEFRFRKTLPEFFDAILHDKPATIEEKPQTLFVHRKIPPGDKVEFAKQVVWYGRRSCRALEPVTWR